MTADQLSAPGSSQYDSGTMQVGDGTWDATDNTFLLPNLVGLNLATTQYNGMGNRFKDLLPYHSLITAHAAIACITFLLLIPTSILIARFAQDRRRRAIRAHIWINILVVFLITVVLILGWFAVGPERSLTNPHHAIGVALYTLILVQVLGGALMRHREKLKDRNYIPVKVMLHHWFGRIIAILGLAQIPLGFALYGSPKGLFIMYAFVMAFWIMLYFILSHRYQSERFVGSEYGSYVSHRSHIPSRHEDIIEERREKRRDHLLRDTALIGGGLAALAALRGKYRSRRDREDSVVDDESVDHVPRTSHRRTDSESVVDEEKYAATRPTPDNTWRNRLLGAGAGLAAFEGARKLFGRRTQERDEEGSIGGYSQPPLGDNSRISHADISRVQSGQVPFSPSARRTRMADTSTYASSLGSPSRTGTRSELVPSEAEVESPHSTFTPAPQGRIRRPRRQVSISSESSILTAESPSRRPSAGISRGQGIAATLAGLTGLAYFREKNRQRRERKAAQREDQLRRHDEGIPERVYPIPRPPGHDERSVFDDEARENVGTSTSTPPVSQHRPPDTAVPPLPISAGAAHSDEDATFISSPRAPRQRPGYPMDNSAIPIPTGPGPASEARFKGSNASRVHFEDEILPAAAAGTAAAIAAHTLSEDRSPRSNRPVRQAEPPVAVKVRIHDDNRHVTLRRLNDAEAAAERDARRHRLRSNSDLESAAGPGYRRRPGAVTGMPPPPPVHGSPMSPVGSPVGPLGSAGYDTGTGTEMSQFDENRRRRRAERAAAKTREIEGDRAGVGIRGNRGEYD